MAALLANDGARIFSVDIDNIQEFSRRRTASSSSSLPHHVVKDSKYSLEECLKMSDTVITGVPCKAYKVKTDQLRDGVVAINFSSEKNFEADIKDKVGSLPSDEAVATRTHPLILYFGLGIYLLAFDR